MTGFRPVPIIGKVSAAPMKRWIALLLAALLLCGCETPGPPETVPSEAMPRETMPDMDIPFRDSGKVRIPYTGGENWIRYVTSAEQLPEQEDLACYDAAFFRDNALVVLCVRFSSGSIEPAIGAITVRDNQATVTVERMAPEGDLTDDMAAWLLWARVDRDLSCSFRLEDSFLSAGAEKY